MPRSKRGACKGNMTFDPACPRPCCGSLGVDWRARTGSLADWFSVSGRASAVPPLPFPSPLLTFERSLTFLRYPREGRFDRVLRSASHDPDLPRRNSLYLLVRPAGRSRYRPPARPPARRGPCGTVSVLPRARAATGAEASFLALASGSSSDSEDSSRIGGGLWPCPFGETSSSLLSSTVPSSSLCLSFRDVSPKPQPQEPLGERVPARC